MPPKAPPPGTIPKKPESIPPNQTLYIRGVPSAHIQKDDLRTALYLLFSTYGPVLDVVALKTMKMRGQAHIVFRDIQTATQAMRSLDGFEFLGAVIVRQNPPLVFLSGVSTNMLLSELPTQSPSRPSSRSLTALSSCPQLSPSPQR